MTAIASRRPILISILAALSPLLLIGLLDVSFTRFTPLPLVKRLIIESVFCGYLLVLLTLMRWWRVAGFTRLPTARRLLTCAAMLFLPLAIGVSAGFHTAPTHQMLSLTLFILTVSFAEEGLMRGVVLQALLPSGFLRAALLSSLLFGVGHFINLIQGTPSRPRFFRSSPPLS